MAEVERLLLVDADATFRTQARDFLEGEGYAVAEAASGEAALAELGRGPVWLMLLDVLLPDMDGLDLVRSVQRLLAAPPEVVIATGPATAQAAIETARAATAGSVVKPVELRRLGELVRQVHERRQLTRENARLGSELAERLKETEALLSISSTISSTLDVREALRRICRELTRLAGMETAAAYLLDATSERLLPIAGYHVPKEMIPTLMAEPLFLHGEGFHVPLFQERRPVYSDDVARDPRFSHELFRRFSHQSGLLLPLILDDDVAGAFYLVSWTARRQFTERELALAEIGARQATVLLRNARLFEEANRERKRLEVLYDVARRLGAAHNPDDVLPLILNEAMRLLGGDAAGIRLLDGDDLVVAARTDSAAVLMARPRIKVGESLTGRVVATGEPLAVEDLLADTRYDSTHKRGALAEGYHGFVGVPLRTRGRVTGGLNVYTKGRRRFQPDEISLLAALADQASLAIDKAQMLRQAEEGRQAVEQLYQHEREVSQMKSDFVSFVTHQLRTPLAGIRWMLELAGQEPSVPADAASYIGDAQQSANRLIGLVNDLLDIARLERGRIAITPTPVHLGQLTQSVLEDVAALIAEKGHRLAMDGADHVPAALADVQLLRQVVLNLVSNAIKYTPPGGDVCIRMGRDGKSVRWEVKDSGIGIPKASHGRLFEKFYRADNVAAMETEGTGLGLYLVRLIMEQLGGRVWCESEEGRGSTFFFNLPLGDRS
jgi:signal transduction histidine kinase/DNA-binding response OmpR family regulator